LQSPWRHLRHRRSLYSTTAYHYLRPPEPAGSHDDGDDGHELAAVTRRVPSARRQRLQTASLGRFAAGLVQTARFLGLPETVQVYYTRLAPLEGRRTVTRC